MVAQIISLSGGVLVGVSTAEMGQLDQRIDDYRGCTMIGKTGGLHRMEEEESCF